jgi:hypothetical protein
MRFLSAAFAFVAHCRGATGYLQVSRGSPDRASPRRVHPHTCRESAARVKPAAARNEGEASMAIQTTFTVSNETELNAAIQAVGGVAPYTIDITGPISLNTDLLVINLASGRDELEGLFVRMPEGQH